MVRARVRVRVLARVLVLALLFSASTRASPDASRLFEDLLANYYKLARPIVNASEAVEIDFKLKIIQISEVHEKNQVVTINGWLIHRWMDYRLVWTPKDYAGLEVMHIPGEMIWLPDIILYNNAHGSPQVTTVTTAAVYHTGVVIWEPPVIYNFVCAIDIEWFPYDEQFCSMKFGSWSYYGTQVDMMQPFTDLIVKGVDPVTNDTVWTVKKGADITEYQMSGEWDLMSVSSTRHKKIYDCCDYPFVDITYKINIRRKTLFYTVNLITPCVGITFLTCLVFYLPSDSNSKIALCVSILVTLTVFFLLLVEIIPPTSITIPLIGRYLLFTMIMILNIHYCAAAKPVPAWTRTLVIECLPKVLLVKRPARLDSLEKKYAVLRSAGIAKAFMAEAMPLMIHRKTAMQERHDRSRSLYYRQRQQTADNDDEGNGDEFIKCDRTALTDAKIRACKNVVFIAQNLQSKTADKDMRDDWKFVAIVVDRLFLWIFSMTIIVGTIWVILSAPSLRDDRVPITEFDPTAHMFKGD